MESFGLRLIGVSRAVLVWLAVAVALGVTNCAHSESQRPVAGGNVDRDPGGVSKRWYVYKDEVSPENHGYWTNMMATKGKQPTTVLRGFSLGYRVDCLGGTGECIRMEFSFAPLDWAGIAVASEPDCWCPKGCSPFMEVKGARRLAFYARGERGDETIEVKAAILGQECGVESAPKPAASNLIRLTTAWTRYSVDVSQVDLSRLATPFAVFASQPNNRQQMTVYFDEIYFE